ncbi:MAG TPA: cbb3-type cytochrome c oxidase N-terminal domain-containing protein [Bacteroidales bacterium]|nr:cbb3-type cytochrome c oxidase N-terminal domain-containing protein [Bacteroidales bacterium]
MTEHKPEFEINEKLDANLMDHEYDGIRELDNSLPPWWLYLFYGTILFALVYVVLFFFMGKFSQEDELQAQITRAEQELAEYRAANPISIDENSVTLVSDATSLADGKATYDKLCFPCHLANGGGSVGPNFTDDYWLHGNTINDLYRIIRYGVPAKGMISWESQLSPEQMRNVASFILTEFKGKNVAGGKAPQGDLYAEGGMAAADTTAPEGEVPQQ